MRREYVSVSGTKPDDATPRREYPNGVVRTVEQRGSLYVVVWDYSNDKHR